MEDKIDQQWRKSKYSGNGGGNCVEVGQSTQHVVLVRDTKDRDGSVLTVNVNVWERFTASVKRNRPVALKTEPPSRVSGAIAVCDGGSPYQAGGPVTQQPAWPGGRSPVARSPCDPMR